MASYNGHDYVEIAGTKWATMNIGASSVTDYGQYFQWGDTAGYLSSDVAYQTAYKKQFTDNDYKFDNGNSSARESGMTKYNDNDSKTVLDLCDDAALANWGKGWRMPTKDECEALCNAVNTEWTESYQGSGVSGFVCTDKTDSSKVLFFPACGWCSNGSVSTVGSSCNYWSSSISSESTLLAYEVGAYYMPPMPPLPPLPPSFHVGHTGRMNGCPVRPVVDDHAYVDLGLPSGTLWAKCNIGAARESDYGNYYQYGKGANDYSVTSGQSNYSGTENPLSMSVDTARQAWGGLWHMPTREQFNELTANTTYQWVDNFNGSGVNGGKFTAQNGNYVFLPASGNAWYPDSKYYGCYWSSTPTSSNNACRFYYRNGTLEVGYDTYDNGYFVRGVIG